MLLISNRSALNLQQKKRLWERENTQPIATDDLEKIHQFGNILTYSYQEVCSYCRALDISKIRYVVFDEAHFFLSDARFNAQTYQILTTLIRTFLGAVRIYMTATPEQVEPILAEYERQAMAEKVRCIPKIAPLSAMWRGYGEMLCYRMEPKSDKIQFSFFKEWGTICKCIAQVPPDEKWLIFVQNTDEWNEIKNRLKEATKRIKNSPKIDCVSAQNKSTSKSYKEIVRTEKFSVQVLISTIVMDNGVNFNDPKLRHVVIHSCDPISMVQMAGRKRRDGKPVNLYIKVPTTKEISTLFTATRNFMHRVDMHAQGQIDPLDGWGTISSEEQKLFGKNSLANLSTLVLNPLAVQKIHLDAGVLEDLRDCCKDDPEEGFQKKIAAWFKYQGPLDTTIMEETPENKERSRDAIIEVIQTFGGTGAELTLQQCMDFQKEIAGSYEEKFGCKMKIEDDPHSLSREVNQVLDKLDIPYRFKKKYKTKLFPEEQWCIDLQS